MAIDRRQFLDQGIKSGLAAAIGAAGPRAVAKPVAPNDKVVVGVMGVGGRGTQLTGFFADRPDVEIAYICDVNAKQLPGAVKVVRTRKAKRPRRSAISAAFWRTNPWMPWSAPLPTIGMP